MLTLIRTNSENKNFQNLVLELDKDLAKKNGIQMTFLHSIIKLTLLKT